MPGLDAEKLADVGLPDCYEALASYIERRDLTDVVLVGHSWAGLVLSGTAPRLASRLSRLVYVSAFVPLHGESLLDLLPPEQAAPFDGMQQASGDGTVSLPLEVFQAAFMQDAGDQAQRIVHSLLAPQPARLFTDPSDCSGFPALAIRGSLSRNPSERGSGIVTTSCPWPASDGGGTTRRS